MATERILCFKVLFSKILEEGYTESSMGNSTFHEICQLLYGIYSVISTSSMTCTSMHVHEHTHTQNKCNKSLNPKRDIMLSKSLFEILFLDVLVDYFYYLSYLHTLIKLFPKLQYLKALSDFLAFPNHFFFFVKLIHT